MSKLSGIKVGDFVTIFERGGWGPPGISKDEVVEISKAGNIKLSLEAERIRQRQPKLYGTVD